MIYFLFGRNKITRSNHICSTDMQLDTNYLQTSTVSYNVLKKIRTVRSLKPSQKKCLCVLQMIHVLGHLECQAARFNALLHLNQNKANEYFI